MKNYIMSRTKIHKDKAKFKAGFGITEKYRLQANRRNFERGYFKDLRNKLREKSYEKLHFVFSDHFTCN